MTGTFRKYSGLAFPIAVFVIVFVAVVVLASMGDSDLGRQSMAADGFIEVQR